MVTMVIGVYLFIAGQRFEVFNIDSKQMITKTKIHDPVCFWTWLNSDLVAMVIGVYLFIAGQRFEVFNIDSKQMITKTKIHDPVCFWTWLNSDLVAMVTDTTVYHWNITKSSKFILFFPFV